MIKIAVDVMGGDFAPVEQIKGTMSALERDNNFFAYLVGDEEKIREELKNYKYDESRIEIVHAPDIITNDDIPTKAIKTKKTSSTVVAFQLVKEGKADGLVCSGSTGAVLAGGVMMLGRIKGISRPALCPCIPNKEGGITLLCDCGANLECKSINFAHFAIMATAYAQSAYDIKSPRVGLLNNGTEDHKGDIVHQEANALLKTMGCIDYIGNVEGRDIMLGGVDVVVADGYTGNIALKSIEGCGKAISSILKKQFTRNWFSKLRALFVKDVIGHIKKTMDYEEKGGAMLLGLSKTVVKGHGNSKAKGFSACVLQAVSAVRGEMVQKIEQMLAQVDLNVAPPQTEVAQ